MVAMMITIMGDKMSKIQLFCSAKKLRNKWTFVK